MLIDWATLVDTTFECLLLYISTPLSKNPNSIIAHTQIKLEEDATQDEICLNYMLKMKSSSNII